MSFCKITEYDLFVSYASVDDIDESGRGKGWIMEFVEYLGLLLRSRLGGSDDLRIYYDNHSLSGNQDLETLLTAARKTCLFLSVASRAYRDREWTKRELAAFCERKDYNERLFIVEYMPLRPGEDYMPPLNGRKLNQFWTTDAKYGVNTTLQMGDRDYRLRVNMLATQIAEVLISARRQADGSGPIDSSSHLANVQAAKRNSHSGSLGKLVIGQTAADMEADADRIRSHFIELGYEVTDAATLRQGGAEFRADLLQALRQAQAFVLPIGPAVGRLPPDLPEGYYAAQIAVAEAAGVPSVFWRRPTITGTDAASKLHAELLDGTNVTAATFNSLISQVLDLLEANRNPPDMTDQSTDGPVVLINAAPEDRGAALKLQDDLVHSGITSVLPLSKGDSADVRADLVDRLVECDVLLVLYGKVGPSWVRSQLALASKMRPKMVARIKAVLIGEANSSSSDVGFRAPDLNFVDVSPDWRHDPVIALMRPMT
jgi:hypothetical protein